MAAVAGAGSVDRLSGESVGPASASRWLARRTLYSLLVLALLTALALPLLQDSSMGRGPQARAGSVDLAAVSLSEKPVRLDGEWVAFLHGASGSAGTGSPVEVPGSWTNSQPEWPRQGRVTYRLDIQGLQQADHILHIPMLYAASAVRINGRPASTRGSPTESGDNLRYGLRAQYLPATPMAGRLRIEIDLATAHHRDHGLEHAPVLGSPDAMGAWTSLQWVQSLMFPVALFLIAIHAFMVFLFRPSDRASLFLAASCFSAIPILLIVNHDSILAIIAPGLPFTGVLAVQYVCGVLALGFFVAYVDALFPFESRRVVFRAILAVLGLLLAAQVALLSSGNTLAASDLTQAALPVRMLIFIYLIGVATVAAIRKRESAAIFLVGIAAFLAMIALRGLVTNGFLVQGDGLTRDLTPVGILVFVFSQVIILADRWSRALAESEQSNSELRRLLEINTSISTEIDLEPLLRKIVSVTTEIVHADRSSLFLHDGKNAELWALVAEGTDRELRFADDRGVAGYCFQTGKPVVIDKAYKDPRFLDDIDEATGYRTDTLLAVPIISRNGRKHGVMEALNRKNGERFSADDVARMMAFASQAAIAIENATLFAEVISERNYNDSILSSMRNGVFTVDAAGIIAKSNSAAQTILARAAIDLEGLPAEQVLQPVDPAVASDVRAVLAAHEPRTFLDIEFLRPSGDRISANLTIVPLVREEEDNNTLVVIEDISEGKRLKGTLRRFIPAQVVDEVLERKDDLLFGNACDASVLFSDIRNFTTLAERMSPRETVDMLNGVFEDLYEAVTETGGVVDKFIGDAVMAVYGVPLAAGNDAHNAVSGARRMIGLVSEINRRTGRTGDQALRLGIGISTGEVIAGTIGSPKRMDYTVIGDSVNLASRLQSTTKYYRVAIVVSEATAAVAGSEGMRELDLIRVRGRERPETIFQVVGDERARDPAFRDMAARYAEGRSFYMAREFHRAVAAFEAALSLAPGDHPSRIMRDRARLLARKPPTESWDGVWTAA